MRVGVVDLGSSSFSLLVADPHPRRLLAKVLRRRVPLRLALHPGRIPAADLEAAEEAVRYLDASAREAGAERLTYVGTEALRAAPNGWELVSRLSRAAGRPIRLLGGIDEARLAYAGMRASVPRCTSPALALDLGGGSLQLAVGERARARWAASLDVGVLRLMARHAAHDPPTPAECLQIERTVRRRLLPTIRRLGAPPAVLATGGTVRGLGRVLRATSGHRGLLESLPVRPEDLRGLRDLLLGTGLEDRLGIPGLRRHLAEVLPTAAVVFAELVSGFGAREVTITRWGLREGVALRLLEEHHPEGVALLAPP